MTDLRPDCEASTAPVFPYLFHCPSWDEDHVAIGFEKHQIEWIRDLIDESIRFHECSFKKDVKEGKKDVEEIRLHEGEINVSKHILKDVIQPGLREFTEKGFNSRRNVKGNDRISGRIEARK